MSATELSPQGADGKLVPHTQRRGIKKGAHDRHGKSLHRSLRDDWLGHWLADHSFYFGSCHLVSDDERLPLQP